MIANELNRAKHWIERQDNDHVNACYERAMELTDLMSEDVRWQNLSLKELRRFREMLSKIYSDSVKDSGFNLTLYRLLLQMNPKAWNLLAEAYLSFGSPSYNEVSGRVLRGGKKRK